MLFHLEMVHDVDLLLLGCAVLVQSQQLSKQTVQRIAANTAQLESHRHLSHLMRRPTNTDKQLDGSAGAQSSPKPPVDKVANTNKQVNNVQMGRRCHLGKWSPHWTNN